MIQIYNTVHCTKHSSYTKATTCYLIVCLTYLLFRSAPLPTQATSHAHTLFDLISLGVDAVKRHSHDMPNAHILVHVYDNWYATTSPSTSRLTCLIITWLLNTEDTGIMIPHVVIYASQTVTEFINIEEKRSKI